ncbi:MAG TPA: hypothetical protein VI391_03765 [Thermoanaerobaculia bacterium]
MKRLSLLVALLLVFAPPVFGQFTPNVTLADQMSLSGTGSSTGIDYDGDGLYDFLGIALGVNVDFGGMYSYSVRLIDKNGTELASQTGTEFLRTGSTFFYVYFDGTAIGKNGVNGPYDLVDLQLKNMFGPGALVAPLAFATDPFLASQFSGFRGDTTPPNVTVSASPALLWPVDHKMREIKVNVSATDDMDSNPSVVLESITSNQEENMLGDGTTSPDILVKNGRVFLRAERSGTIKGDRVYVITYSATDASGNVGKGIATVTVPHNQ